MLFTLTSCDKLLDIIFANNTINVDVRAVASKYYTYGSPGVGITVTLYGSDGSTYTSSQSSNYLIGPDVDYYITFSRLSNATYSLYASYNGATSPVGSTSTTTFTDPAGYLVSSMSMPYAGYGDNDVTISVRMP